MLRIAGWATSCRDFAGCIVTTEPRLLIYSDGLALQAFDESGLAWQTRRVSWDGISELAERAGGFVTGVSWEAIGEEDVPFDVDLRTGAATGGGYEE